MVKTKLKNKVIIIALLILLFIGVLSNITKEVLAENIFYPQGYTNDKGEGYQLEYQTDIDHLNIGDKVKVRKGVLTLNKNVFCVQHGQALPGDLATYQVKEQYTITSEGIDKKNSSGSTFISVAENSDLVNFAQGIAYILQLDNEWDGDVNSQAPSDASPAQRILWEYLDKATKEYCNAVGMEPSESGATTVTLKSGEQKLFNTAMKLWKGDSYTETNFDSNALKRSYKAEYYTFANVSNDTQKLILLKSTSDVVKDNKKIEITINKKDHDEGTNIQAGFTVKFTQGGASIPGVSNKTLNTTGGTASTGEIEITDTSKDVVVTISETSVPDGYIGLSGNITLTFKYEDNKWKKVSQTISDTDTDYVSISGTNNITLNITNERIKKFYLDLTKKSSIDGADINAMDGTKFEINFNLVDKFKVYGKYLSDGLIPNYRYEITIDEFTGKWRLDGVEIPNVLQVCDGKIQFEEITPRTIVWHEMKNVFIRISEKEALEGYKKLNRKILIKANLSNPENIDIDYFISPDDIGDSFEDIWQKIISGDDISEIDLWTTNINNAGEELKKDINKIGASGAKISLELTNQKLITIKGRVWNDGQTGLKTSSGANGKNDDDRLDDIPPYNSGLDGIKVYLCRKKGSWLGDDWEKLISDVIVAEQVTKDGGYYEFPNMEELSNMYITFEYDGMKYIETVGAGFGTRGNDSDAEENAVDIKHDGAWYYKYDTTEKKFIKASFDGETYVEIKSKSRNDFNKQFELIKHDGAYQFKDITTVKEKFDQIDALGSGITLENLKSILGEESKAKYIWNNIITADGDWKTKIAAIKQAIYSDSFYIKTTDLEYYKEDGDGKITSRVNTSSNIFKMYATNVIDKTKIKTVDGESVIEINCGLVKREFDLDLSTNLETVKTEINGKTTNYKYSIDDTGNATLYVRDEGDEGKLSKQTYNQAIYESDYNYNIDDYFDNTGSFALDDATGEKQQFKNDANEIHNDGTDELDIYVTYRIQINNQNNKTAYVYEIEDYYSNVFEGIVSCKDENENGIAYTSLGEKTIGGENYKKIQIQLSNSAFEKDGANYLPKVIYLVFKLDKTKLSTSDLEIGNIAEITSYGSDEGLIDMNSAPGNAYDGSNIRYEDDTDKAGVLNVKIDSSKKRTLSGIVWDDENKNGKYDTGEKLVNGVTVQLIELREVDGITLEYIWQEMITGEDKVSKIDLDGSSVKEYTYTGDVNKKGLDEYIYIEGYNKTKEEFHYLFTGYIPGNYIVRYKYGLDGGTYNGNDYKSTYDRTGAGGNAGTRYKGTSQLNLTENERFSDAFDNEARRLEEMAIFAGETVTSTTSLDLVKHWMCADTNKFELCFEDPDYTVEDGEQTVKAVDNNASQKDIGNCTVEKIDFGLMKRPKTEVSLEKHLTALAIDVAGEGKILDAVFDLKGFNDAGSGAKMQDYIKGIKANLSTIYSERDERGFWKFETDVNELMNGAELTAEYTYVVSNNSEGDYLSAQLMNAYEQLNKGEPCQFIYEGETSETTLVPGVTTFKTLLDNSDTLNPGLAQRTKTLIRLKKHTNGYYLGDHYYTGNADNIVDLKGGTSESILEGHGTLSNWKNKLAGVTIRVDKIEELINNEFYFDEDINYSSYGPYNNFTADSTKVTPAHPKYYEYKENETSKSEINTTNYALVQSKGVKTSLRPGDRNYNRKIVLTKTLNTNNINDISFDSYNAEILSYSIASGRGAETTKPGNLEYSYSANKDDTLVSLGNEPDEFWGETIIITAPTGNNTALWIILGVTCALIIAGGVLGIKKFVLKH